MGILNFLVGKCVSLHLSAIEAADILQKLSLDSQPKTIEIPDAAKKVWICVLFTLNASFVLGFTFVACKLPCFLIAAAIS